MNLAYVTETVIGLVMGQKATRRWKINQFDKKQGACKSYIQLI